MGILSSEAIGLGEINSIVIQEDIIMLDNVLDIETMETDLELRDVLRYSYRKEWEETLLTQI